MSILDQVAQRAGVSARTVTRVMRGDIKERWPSAASRAARIRQIARELGYRPNSSASAIRNGRFDCLGLLLSADEGRSNLPPMLLDGVHDELLERRMHLTIARLPDEALGAAGAFPRILEECCCDGLLVNYTDRIPAPMLQRLAEDPVPTVWLNCRRASDCIHYADLDAGRLATQTLIERGHRRIAYVDFTDFDANPENHYSRFDRHAGYLQAMREAGLTPWPRQRFIGLQRRARLDALVELLRSPQRPTAVISYDAGERVLLAATMAGLSVPRDLSIITFGDELPGEHAEADGESFIGVRLAKLRLPTHEAGRQAVRMLLRKIEQPELELPALVLPIRLDGGESLAALAHA